MMSYKCYCIVPVCEAPRLINVLVFVVQVIEVVNPCNPSPCGSNALCKERNGAGSCVCMPEYFGDPYINCRPECMQNSDCSHDKSCMNRKCVDPCIGTCGINAECRVTNHYPICTCTPGYTGNPLQLCHIIPTASKNSFAYCVNDYSLNLTRLSCTFI